MCAIPINWYEWDWGESEEKNLSRLLYRICGSGYPNKIRFWNNDTSWQDLSKNLAMESIVAKIE